MALNCLNIAAMEVLGGRHEDSSGAPTPLNIGIDNALTGEGYEQMDPLIPVARSKGSRTGYDLELSDLRMPSIGDGDDFGPQEPSLISEVTSSVFLPPR